MPPEDEHRVQVHLDRLLVERGITLTELSDRVGLTLAGFVRPPHLTVYAGEQRVVTPAAVGRASL